MDTTMTPPKAPNLPATPAAGEATVSLTIDGQNVAVRKGTNVLEAAKCLGKDICHFCYHPGLSIAASCRQCLVEIEKNPKLQPSCQVPVAEGMVVHTNTPNVLQARQHMLEFTLKNHPIDCPICDKAGECTLQRHYMTHDHTLSRVDVPKIRKPKVKDIGREILLDAERCILCSRCVRFCEEVPKTSELTMVMRGDREEIDVAAGARLDNAYSMNVVDICPVGALTAKDFRFQIRAWELTSTPTTCTGCATGCATELHSHHETAYRMVPRLDPEVNGHWMCDEGRYTYKSTAEADRVLRASVDGGVVVRAAAIDRAKAALSGRVGARIAVVFSACATNEANAALADLADHLHAQRFYYARKDGEGDTLLRSADKNPNRAGAQALWGNARDHDKLALELGGGAFDAVVILDAELPLSPVVRQALGNLDSICLADRHTQTSAACKIVLPSASWAEMLGTFVNRQGKLRVLGRAWSPQADRMHPADTLADILRALGVAQTPRPLDRTRGFAQTHGNDELLHALNASLPRPTLLRFEHSRG